MSEIVHKLNEAIESSTSKLLKKDKNPQTIQNIQHMIEIRQKELQNSKNQANLYRQQYEIINSKATERFSGEKYNIVLLLG